MAAVFRAAIETAAGPLFRLGAVERGARPRRDYRNGYYERDLVTRFGTIRLRIARTRGKSFLPCGLRPFQRRAEEVAILIRAAFLRGISTRQVGRVVATLTGEVVSPQTVSKLTRDLDQAVREFHQARLDDDYGYLFLDGLSLRCGVRRGASGCRCWWPMECAATAAVPCWLSCAARAKARPTGKLCSQTSTGGDWKANIWL